MQSLKYSTETYEGNDKLKVPLNQLQVTVDV